MKNIIEKIMNKIKNGKRTFKVYDINEKEFETIILALLDNEYKISNISVEHKKDSFYEYNKIVFTIKEFEKYDKLINNWIFRYTIDDDTYGYEFIDSDNSAHIIDKLPTLEKINKDKDLKLKMEEDDIKTINEIKNLINAYMTNYDKYHLDVKNFEEGFSDLKNRIEYDINNMNYNAIKYLYISEDEVSIYIGIIDNIMFHE